MKTIKASLKAYAKINLYLNVIKKLDNKYHEIETMFCLCDIYDEIVVNSNAKKNLIIYSGTFSQGINPRNNTVLKLIKLLKKNSNFNKYKFKIEIKKNIPHGSGLGGGSSDVARLISFFNERLNLKLKKKTISTICKKIGADVEPLLSNNLKILYGRNKILEIKKKLQLNLLLVYPSFPNSTKEIYVSNKNFTKSNYSDFSLLPKILLNKKYFINFLNKKNNDLEQAAFKKNKKTLDVLTYLKKLKGCRLARMTGSGSCCFAIFENNKQLTSAIISLKQRYKTYWIKKVKII
jgi:4-diphosphocytidyl-2-C-methyl-D-erythritol kinase